jgi:hypothetical protein
MVVIEMGQNIDRPDEHPKSHDIGNLGSEGKKIATRSPLLKGLVRMHGLDYLSPCFLPRVLEVLNIGS